jgi:hypothetical protein
VLGALGAVGGAAAIGGAGTAALLWDHERPGESALVAGALDAKVGWEVRYDDGPGDTLEERVPPDGLDPGADPCEVLADASDRQRPVVDLSDVKPGDAGSVSFRLALCSNPGLVGLTGSLREDDERGLTDPERDDPDEYSDDDAPTTGSSPTLTLENDRLRATVSADLSGGFAGQPWLFTPPDGRDRDVLFFEIYALRDDDARADAATGAFAPAFPPTGVPGTRYPATFEVTVDGVALAVTRAFTLDPVDALLTVDYRFENVGDGTLADLRYTQYVDFDLGPSIGGDRGTFRVDADRDLDYVRQSRQSPEESVVAGFGASRRSVGHAVGRALPVLNRVFSPARLPGTDRHEGDVSFALEYSLGRLAPGEAATLTTAYALARDPALLEPLLLKPRLPLGGGDLTDAVEVTVRVRRAGTDDPGPVVFEGSLAHLLALAASGPGLSLRGPDPGSECFAPSPAVHDVTVDWRLPVDHANELQSDAVGFDLGLAAEQCRHDPGRR